MNLFIIILSFVICFFVSYFIGCFNLAYVLGKRRHIDIRRSGSGNPGASNAMTTMGWRAGIAVGATDIFKAALPIVVLRIFRLGHPLLWIVTAVACILGHMYPVTMGFKGGKGLACLIGVFLAFDWRVFLGAVAVVVIITLVTDYIAIASVLLALAFPVLAYFVVRDHAWQSACVSSAASVCMVVKHVPNIKRIINGTEIGLRNASSGKYRKNDEQ